MTDAMLAFAYDVLRSFLVAGVLPGDPRTTGPVRALVAALPPEGAASVSDMRVLMNEIIRGHLQAFADDRVLLEPHALVAIPLAFIARTALEHDGSASWSAERWADETRRSSLRDLTLGGGGTRGT